MLNEHVPYQHTAASDLDPRVKTVFAFSFSLLFAVLNQFSVIWTAFAAGYVSILCARVPVKKTFLRLVPVNLIILTLFLVLPFTFPGTSVFDLGPFTATKEGLFHVARIWIKSNGIMLVLIALVASTPPVTIAHAMHQLGVSPKLVHLFLFTYRYIHVIYQEYLRSMNAVKIRCFKPGNNRHTYKTLAYLAGRLFVNSYDRSYRVHHAMLCRGFHGVFFSLTDFKIRRKDVVFAVFTGAFLLLLGVMEWTDVI